MMEPFGGSLTVSCRDEIDKVGQSNHHGDPAAALLEVLDPEQNHTFNVCLFIPIRAPKSNMKVLRIITSMYPSISVKSCLSAHRIR